MFKPTPYLQKALRRLPLSPKQAGKEYYKGSGVGNLGTIDKFGRFHPDYSKIRTFVFPVKGTEGFELTPFVGSRTPKNVDKGKIWETPPEGMTGEEYLGRWKMNGGHDPVHVPYDKSQAQAGRTNMPEVREEPAEKK